MKKIQCFIIGVAELIIVTGLIFTATCAEVIAADTQVNTYTTNNQTSPSVALDANGNFVIAWESYGQDSSGWGVYAQLYDNNGAAVGGEFQVNTHSDDYQWYPAAAMDANGNFIVVWESDGQDGDSTGVYAQRFNSSGTPVGAEFQVNTYTSGSQYDPAVAMDSTGDFIIVWTSDVQDGGSAGIFAQRYNSSGASVGAEFKVNTYPTGTQDRPSTAMDTNGNFIVVWESEGQDGNGDGVYAQRYNSSGIAVGAEFQVNTHTSGSQYDPAVAMDSSGNFVITWTSTAQDGSDYGVYGQLYASTGATVGSEFRVNTYITSYQFDSSVAMDPNGNFITAWQSFGQDGSLYGVYAQEYDRFGVALGSEFKVNTITASTQGAPSAVMSSSGNFVITWQSNNQDGSSAGIFMKSYFSCSDPVRNGRTHDIFPTIQAAIDDINAVNFDVIQVTAGDFNEDILFDRDIILTLSGGYFCDYSDNPETSSIKSLVISDGTIIVENLVIF